MDLSFLGNVFSGPEVEKLIGGVVGSAAADPGKLERIGADLFKLIADAIPDGHAVKPIIVDAQKALADLASAK